MAAGIQTPKVTRFTWHRVAPAHATGVGVPTTSKAVRRGLDLESGQGKDVNVFY